MKLCLLFVQLFIAILFFPIVAQGKNIAISIAKNVMNQSFGNFDKENNCWHIISERIEDNEKNEYCMKIKSAIIKKNSLMQSWVYIMIKGDLFISHNKTIKVARDTDGIRLLIADISNNKIIAKSDYKLLDFSTHKPLYFSKLGVNTWGWIGSSGYCQNGCWGSYDIAIKKEGKIVNISKIPELELTGNNNNEASDIIKSSIIVDTSHPKLLNYPILLRLVTTDGKIRILSIKLNKKSGYYSIANINF